MKAYCAHRYLYWGGVEEGVYDRYEFCFGTYERMLRVHRWYGDETVRRRQVFVSLAKEKEKLCKRDYYFAEPYPPAIIIPPSTHGGGVNVSQIRADPAGRTSLRRQFKMRYYVYFFIINTSPSPPPDILCTTIIVDYCAPVYLYFQRSSHCHRFLIFSTRPSFWRI